MEGKSIFVVTQETQMCGETFTLPLQHITTRKTLKRR